MPNEYELALKSAAASVAKYVQDAATMVVETKYIEIDSKGLINFDDARSIARTEIKLDGDSMAIVPMRRNDSGVLEIDANLFELHQQNVSTAIEYRARILNALLATLVSQRRGA